MVEIISCKHKVFLQLDGILKEAENVISAVPQGPLLGPFLIFFIINNIPQAL